VSNVVCCCPKKAAKRIQKLFLKGESFMSIQIPTVYEKIDYCVQNSAEEIEKAKWFLLKRTIAMVAVHILSIGGGVAATFHVLRTKRHYVALSIGAISGIGELILSYFTIYPYKTLTKNVDSFVLALKEASKILRKMRNDGEKDAKPIDAFLEFYRRQQEGFSLDSLEDFNQKTEFFTAKCKEAYVLAIIQCPHFRSDQPFVSLEKVKSFSEDEPFARIANLKTFTCGEIEKLSAEEISKSLIAEIHILQPPPFE
jgi:hypothetical protein